MESPERPRTPALVPILSGILDPVLWGLEYLITALACALIGVTFIQVILRYVFNTSFFGAEELARFVNDTAPYFFVPRYVEFLEALPATPTGRVQKYLLRERGVTPQTWDAKRAGFEPKR